VDEVLEAAWPDERRRTLRRWNLGTLVRIAVDHLALCGLPLIVQLTAGISVRWAVHALIGGMTVSTGIREARVLDHLRYEGR
jgi:hypothetical protein